MNIPENFPSYFDNHSNEETAKYFEVCKTTIWKWSRKLGLKRKIRKYKDFSNYTFTDRQKNIITGSLLGDGSLKKIDPRNYSSNSSFTESHSEDQKNYLFWKHEELIPLSNRLELETRNKTIKVTKGKISYAEEKHEIWVFKTIAHPLFTDMEKYWYLRDDTGNYVFNELGRRIKIVPDIKLTPLSMSVWYFDDGWKDSTSKNFYLSTLSFTKEECEKLTHILKSLNVKSYVRLRGKKKQPEIGIRASSYFDFVDILKENLPSNCVSYKI